MNSHPTKYRERFDEIFIVLCKRQIIEFIDQLNNTDYLTGGILDGHAKNCTVFKTGTVIH